MWGTISMGPSLVKAGEKQKPPPSIIKGGGIFNGNDLKVCQLERYILIESAILLKILLNCSSLVSSRVERNPCRVVANEDNGTTHTPVAPSR